MAILIDTQIRNNLYATGSVSSGGGFTGSFTGSLVGYLLGTSSYSNQSSTASYVLNAVYSSISTQSLYSTQSISSISSSFSSASISSSYTITSSYINGFNFYNTNSVITSSGTDNIIMQLITGSYIAAFFDYALLSGSNSRAGTIFGSWVSGSIEYTEVSNVDIGNTSGVTMSMALNNNNIRLLVNSSTIPWIIRVMARYI